MITISKEPASFISLLSAVGAAGITSVAQRVFGLSPGRALWLFGIIWGALILTGDTWYRRRKSMSMFDLRASTLYFVIPTWLSGAFVLLITILAGIFLTID